MIVTIKKQVAIVEPVIRQSVFFYSQMATKGFIRTLTLPRAAANNSSSSIRSWHVIDAEGHRVGRLASQISNILQGKHKPIYSRSADLGDYVVVTNLNKIQFATEAKWKKKQYRWHTGYPGGLKEVPAERMKERFPTRILEHAVRGMVPKNRTRKVLMDRLKLYAGPDHPHGAQVANILNRTSVLRSNVLVKEHSPPAIEQPEEKFVMPTHGTPDFFLACGPHFFQLYFILYSYFRCYEL